jgi:hypothetical protein
LLLTAYRPRESACCADASTNPKTPQLKLLGADELPRRMSAAEIRLRAVAAQQSAAGKEATAQGKLLEK